MAKSTSGKTAKTTHASAGVVAAAASAAPTASTAVTPVKLRPLGDRVVLRPTPGEEMTKSGILIPDTVKERPQEGEVLAVGPGKTLDDGKREPMDVAVGDKVLYAKYAGTEFKLGGEDLLIVGAKDILAVVES